MIKWKSVFMFWFNLQHIISCLSKFPNYQIHTSCCQFVVSSDVGVSIHFANITNVICRNSCWRWSLWGWWSRSWFCTFHQCAMSSNTTFHFATHNFDIATISPFVTPGILDQPIRCSILSSISNNGDGMVDTCARTLVKNTLIIVTKTMIASIDSSGNSSIFVD